MSPGIRSLAQAAKEVRMAAGSKAGPTGAEEECWAAAALRAVGMAAAAKEGAARVPVG